MNPKKKTKINVSAEKKKKSDKIENSSENSTQ